MELKVRELEADKVWLGHFAKKVEPIIKEEFYARLLEIREHIKEVIGVSREPNELWKENTECPNCGAKTNQRIRSCETGYSYCSYKCASEHVIANEPDGGY